ncbi:MAG: hypothetical protein V3U31_07325 [Dehalococcoidia bacterium]
MQLDEEVAGVVAAAVEFALNSPLPPPEAALADVYGPGTSGVAP